jgi:hypothetical protein
MFHLPSSTSTTQTPMVPVRLLMGVWHLRLAAAVAAIQMAAVLLFQTTPIIVRRAHCTRQQFMIVSMLYLLIVTVIPIAVIRRQFRIPVMI